MDWATEKAYNTFMEQCGICKHLDKDNADSGFFVCKAFPDGIPEKFLDNKKRHNKPYPGDNGFQFEKIEE